MKRGLGHLPPNVAVERLKIPLQHHQSLSTVRSNRIVRQYLWEHPTFVEILPAQPETLESAVN